MLKSMTGFGAGEAENDSFLVSIEVKAVNQRFLDVDFRMPRRLDVFEDTMKRKIKEYASRGKLTFNVQFMEKREREWEIQVDKSLAISYHKALNDISDLLRLARSDDVGIVASYPGIITAVEKASSLDEAEPVIIEALDAAMKQFVSMREAEGENLKTDFEKRIVTLEKYVDEIEALGPSIVAHYRERLEKAIGDLLSANEIDENRIIQETFMYADKVNYTEEVVRLRSHFAQFRQIISDAAEPVGRKLDFLIQEMNREINTIASKANSAQATRLAVEVKSEIEKLREQVQNVE
ncbi:MAG: YicC family protein [Schwartzia sp.]|nr:YicC family protein [Schwartzia sp. (in: firmicutes)]